MPASRTSSTDTLASGSVTSMPMHDPIDPNCMYCVYRVCREINNEARWEQNIHASFPTIDTNTAYIMFNTWMTLDAPVRERVQREDRLHGGLSEARVNELCHGR